LPRGPGVRVPVGFDGAERGSECRAVRGSLRSALRGSVRGPERTGQSGRVPERGAKLTGAGCA